MTKRLSIIKESDCKFPDSSRSFNFGRSSYTKNSESDSNKSFHGKRTCSQTVPMQISLHAHSEVAEEARESDCPGACLKVFSQVWAKKTKQDHPRVVGLLQHGYHLVLKNPPKLSKLPLILSE